MSVVFDNVDPNQNLSQYMNLSILERGKLIPLISYLLKPLLLYT